jgi:hypothetical protein
MRRVLFRLGVALAIAGSFIALAWTEAPIGSWAASAPIWGLLGILTASLIGAVILRAAAAWVERKDVKFADAYATMLLCGIATLILRAALGLSLGGALRLDSEIALRVASVPTSPLSFLIHAGLIGLRHDIRFRRACLVCLVMLAVSAAMALSVAVVAYLIERAYRRAGVL